MTHALVRLTVLALLASGCREAQPGKTVWLTVHTKSKLEAGGLQVEAGQALRWREVDGTLAYLAFDLEKLPDAVRVRHPGSCLLEVSRQSIVKAPQSRALRPVVELGGPFSQVGYGRSVKIEVRKNCPQQAPNKIEWRLVEGQVTSWRAQHAGYRLRIVTASFDDSFAERVGWGVIPISPRTQGAATFEASWRDGSGRRYARRLVVSSAARATGVPAVAPGVALYLGGEGWRVVRSAGGKAELAPLGERSDAWRFVATAPGEWVLADSADRKLPVHVGRWDAPRLDCGRAECHEGASRAATSSPMTRTMRGAVSRGALKARCGMACHAVGEPGLDDGGFYATWIQVGQPPLKGSWQLVHRDLRRLGGVTCVVCHGTSAIPALSTRWTQLRSAVCAYCHDAPPRYAHTQAFAGTKMARGLTEDTGADRPECTRCHTTAGFLASLRRDALAEQWHSPSNVRQSGLDCAACHSAHDPAWGEQPPQALLRTVPVPPLLVGANLQESKARVCLPCHADVQPDGPWATAGLLWLGRGGVDPQTGAPVVGPAPYAEVEGGCIGCHAHGPKDLERGVGHRFSARLGDCDRCPAYSPQAADVQRRARQLWRRLQGAAAPSEPIHAVGTAASTDEVGRRLVHNLRLVLEDRAAAYHNPDYADKLLELTAKGIESRHD